MKRYIFTTLFLMSATTTISHAEVSEDNASFEKRIAQLEAEASAPRSAMSAGTPIKINGFISAGATYLDDETLQYDGGSISTNVNWKSTSRVGLQFDLPANEKVGAMVQLLALGIDDFQPYMPLAYISYRPSAQNEYRVGRQRMPFFMLSEYLDVGYAYPWARPPVETYSAALPINIEGASWIHRNRFGNWSHEFQVIGGDSDVHIPGLDGHLDDLLGLNVMSTYEDWTLRAGYLWTIRANASAPALAPFGATPMVEADASFAGLGAQYDNGSLLVIAEITSLAADGFYPDTDSGFITTGWRFGKLLPTITVAESRVTDKSDRTNPFLPLACPGVACLDDNPPGSGNGTIPFPANTLNKLIDAEQQTVTLELRYDYMENISAKFDISAVMDTSDGWGAATPLDVNGNGTGIDEQLFSKPDTPFMVYRLVFDMVF